MSEKRNDSDKNMTNEVSQIIRDLNQRNPIQGMSDSITLLVILIITLASND